MPYHLGKALAFLAQPSTLIVLAIAIGIWRMRRAPANPRGFRLALAGLTALVIAGLSPLANALILPLEQRFPKAQSAQGQPIAGIILLGGFEDGWVSAGRGGLGLNESADRLTEGLRLARTHPEARVVFTGGAGGFLTKQVEAGGPVAEFLKDAGIAPERLVLEGRSRTTYENALYTRDLVAPKPGERWLLVTSAYHMPRAMGLFRKAGFAVEAYPVDYRTAGPGDATRPFERISQGLMRTDTAINEWLGLAAYRLLGRIDAVFPAP